MAIEKTTNNQTSIGGGGECSKSIPEFKSLVCVEMKKFSQSELYSLSRSSSDAFDLSCTENDVIPNIEPNRRYTGPITTSTANTPNRIFAFAHRRGHPRRISGPDGDEQVTEDRLILNSLGKLIAEEEAYESNARRDRGAAVDNRNEVQKKKRKRKSNDEKEFEELGVINVKEDVIDLNFLARGGDGAFESELNRMTAAMVTEDELLGFLKSLEGRWGSSRKRRKYVEAAVLVKALPINWKILLSLRPRARRPSLYCRRFVSPSDVHFNSCKDVAFYLRSLFVTKNASRPEEGAMIQVEPECHVDLEYGARAHTSSHPASKTDVLGSNNCMGSSTSTAGIESRLQKCHGNNNNQSLHIDTLNLKRPSPRGLLIIREPKNPPPIIQGILKQKTVVENKDTVTRPKEPENIPVNGEGSSANEQEKDSEVNGNLKTTCIWCHVEFIREPVDAETLASSSGFICPKCKENVCCSFESSLTRLTQRTDN